MMKIIAVVAAAAALGLGLAVAPAGASTATNSTTLHYSSHWAGYAALPKSGGSVTSFNSVSAVLTVPSLNCQTTPNADVSHFVALGGSNAQPIDGVGLRETCQNGTPYYEMEGLYCGIEAGVSFPNPIAPGDTYTVSIGPAFRTSQEISYTDTTTGAGNAELIQSCTGKARNWLSAEVFTYGDVGGQHTADFSQVGFRQVQVEGNTQSSLHPLGSIAWKVSEYVLKGPSGQVDVKPEALLSGKYTSAFANDWKSPN